ncbi:MAG: Gfo/Idh/MocA family protein [Acidimicrobiia bacterium]
MAGAPSAVVIGTGFGLRVHVPALRAAGFDVVALVGTDAERTARRSERAGVPHAFTALDDALAQDDVAAVTIATPPNTHAALAIAACEAGKHVICEKPFALDAAEAEAMCAAAVRAGVGAFVGYEFRWAVDRAVARRAIADGVIGEPRLVSIVQYVPLVASLDAKGPSWWFDDAAGGGWLGASGSHVVDLVRYWLGDFVSVSATQSMVSARDGAVDAADSYTVRFTLANAVEGVIQETAAAWAPGGMVRVAGTEGTLWLERGSVFVADAGGTRELPVPADLVLPDAPEVSTDPRHRFTHLELGPYTRLAEVLMARVRDEPLPTAVPPPTFADGLAAMRVLDAIRRSKGQEVRL